jgi:hypothetical protein
MKHRINISVPDDIDTALTHLAMRDAVSVSSKVLELVQSALALEEDEVLREIAEARDTKNAQFISHEKAWS